MAEAKQDLDSLTKIWTEGKRDGIAEIVKTIPGMKEDEQEELIEILDCHFDPEKKPVKPIQQRRENNQNNQNNGQFNNDNNMRGRRNKRGPRRQSTNKENQGSRNDSRRRKRSSTDKRFNNNNNNNNVMDPKSGAIRKEYPVDANQNNVLVSTN